MEWYMGKYIRPLSDAVFTIASDDLWIESLAIQQLHTTANLPNMQRVVGMPDLHPGRGYPIGAAFFSVGRFTRQDVAVTVLETETGRYSDTLRSALVSLDGDNAWALSESWCGTIQWICPSPYRPHHGRKNWFLGIGRFTADEKEQSDAIRYETLRSSGPGGQHVNKTDSAVRATHLASGISVKVQSERSQHANKRLARLLIARKLEQQQQENSAALKSQRRMFHHQIERGNPRRTFTGMAFIEG